MNKEVTSFTDTLKLHVKAITEAMPNQGQWGLKILLPKSVDKHREDLVRVLQNGPYKYDKVSLRKRPNAEVRWLTIEWSDRSAADA